MQTRAVAPVLPQGSLAERPRSCSHACPGSPRCKADCKTMRMLQVYEEPTVLLAKRVTGEEEVPEGAVAVLTPDAPDVLSHVSVRARNMHVLFAICHEAEPLKEIEDLAGKVSL